MSNVKPVSDSRALYHNILRRGLLCCVFLFPLAFFGGQPLWAAPSAAIASETTDDPRLEFAVKPEVCPRCGGTRIAGILYGKPRFDEELQRDLDEGRIVLGGCVITGDDPQWACTDCKDVFYRTK